MAVKRTTQEVAEILKTKHGLILTSEYDGAHSQITFTCSNGHANTGMATNIIQRGYKCKECSHGRAIIPKIYWDDGKLQKLRELAQTTATVEEIATYFNTTAKAINNVLHSNNILRRDVFTEVTRSKLVDKLRTQDRVIIDVGAKYSNICDYITVKCKNNHIVRQLASNILYKDTDCPKCFSAEGKSRQENTLVEFIKENYSGWMVENDRSILEGKELDLVLPDLGLAFEFNGSYWHSDIKVPNTYHMDKTNAVEDFGYQLIHISSYQWNIKQDIVKSRIKSLLGINTKIYARKCALKEIKWPKQFLDINHIQGAGAPTGINFGLFYNEELVAAATFSKSRFDKNFEYELVRYCSKLDTSIVGGASKLIKAFEAAYRPQSLISYADRRFSTGKLYSTIGFTKLRVTEPGYAYYYKDTKMITRYQAQKSKLETLLSNYDPKLTESENMLQNRYYKMYDSGNIVFAKYYSTTSEEA